MVRRVEDSEFEKLTGLGTTPKVAALQDPERFKVTFQNTGTTRLTIGKSKTSKLILTVGNGWILEPASAIDRGDGGTIELETRDRLAVVSSAAGGQMVRVTESLG